MPPSEAVPVDCEAGLIQRIAKALRANMRKDIVLRAMTLEDRHSFTFEHQWIPDRLSQEVPGKLHETDKRIVGMQDGVTSEHGPL